MDPISPNEVQLEDLRSEFSQNPLPAAQGLMATTYLLSKILPELISATTTRIDATESTVFQQVVETGIIGLKINVKSMGLPIGAGLGSSAAFSVALAGALLLFRQKLFQDVETLVEQEYMLPSKPTLAILNGWAFAAEVVIHGAPSGLDNTTSCYGGAVKFLKSSGKFENLSAFPAINILLVNTKIPRSTKVLVAGVRKLHDAYPEVVKPILDGIEAISQKFLSLIES